MFSLVFASILRFNELVNVRIRDIRFGQLHISLFIPKSETDLDMVKNLILQELIKIPALSHASKIT